MNQSMDEFSPPYQSGGSAKKRRSAPQIGKACRQAMSGMQTAAFFSMLLMALLAFIDLLTPSHMISNLQNMLGPAAVWVGLIGLFMTLVRARHVLLKLVNSKAGFAVVAFVVVLLAWNALHPHSFWGAYAGLAWVVEGFIGMAFAVFDAVFDFVATQFGI